MPCKFGISVAPYSENEVLFKNSLIEINEGITILTGCNGAGKSTLLRSIKENLESTGMPHLYYSNLSQGGKQAISKTINEDLSLCATLMVSSEGEQVFMNFANFVGQLKSFFDMDTDYHMRWLLIDAVDSGLSVDRIEKLRDCFQFLVGEAANKGLRLFIVVSANSYEMCKGMKCFCVTDCEYRSEPYTSYEEWYADMMANGKEVQKRLESLNNT